MCEGGDGEDTMAVTMTGHSGQVGQLLGAVHASLNPLSQGAGHKGTRLYHLSQAFFFMK